MTPSASRHAAIVDVHLMLYWDDRLLLGLRRNTGYEDGKFHLPAGHLEPGESVLAAAQREAEEELGLEIEASALRLAHVMHRQTGGGRIALFFIVDDWQGEPRNAEPEKCVELRWFPTGSLPPNLVDYAGMAVAAEAGGRAFSLDGWLLGSVGTHDPRGEEAA
jgi:8-oxo-dGTP diphosphatase